MIFKLGIIIFLISFLMIGAQLYESDVEYGVERDIYNFTEEKIDIPLSNISAAHPIERTKGIINMGRFYKILESGLNFGFISIEEVSKMGVEYGYQNPTIDWQILFKYVVYILVIIIVVMLLKPIGYIIVFFIMLVITIKDKRRMNRAKQKI